MNPHDVNFSMRAESCYYARLATTESVVLLQKTSFGDFNTRFRSYPQERERNPLDIFCIWQHMAWHTYNFLLTNCHFPFTIADIIMSYAMQSLAPPNTHHGFPTFSCLSFCFFTKKKPICFFCLSESVPAKLGLIDWRRRHDQPFTIGSGLFRHVINADSNEIIFTKALYSGDTNMIDAFLKTSVPNTYIWNHNKQRFWDIMFHQQYKKDTKTTDVICVVQSLFH